jgi:hypothetical protein
VHHSHAAPAAAAGGLDDHRIADRARDPRHFIGLLREGVVYPRHHRYPGFLHRDLGVYLVAQQPDGLGLGADEDEAALLDTFGEIGILREKAPAGMYRLGVRHLRGADDGRNVEIAVRGRRRPDAHRFVGELDVFSLAVRLGMHHHRLDAKLATGALHAQRHFTAVGYQDLFKHS